MNKINDEQFVTIKKNSYKRGSNENTYRKKSMFISIILILIIVLLLAFTIFNDKKKNLDGNTIDSDSGIENNEVKK